MDLRASRLWSLALAFSLLATGRVAAQTYTVTDLGTLGPYETFAFANNDASQVVGYSYIQNGGEGYSRHGYLWQDGTLQDLGAFARQGYSWATDINEAGQICGHAGAGNNYHAFLYQNGSMQDLGWAGEARGLNDQGQVVGYQIDGSLVEATFWSKETGLQKLTGGPEDSEGLAEDLNNHGQAVGWSLRSCTSNPYLLFSRATVWELRQGTWTETDLGALNGGCASDAYAINQAGQIVGESGFTQGTAVLWQKGASGVWTIQNLGSLGGFSSSAQGINNRSQVVGHAQIPDGTPHAFLWQCGTLIDLNSRIPAGSGWVLNEAYDINDLGEIVGYGQLNGGPYRAFLLKPSSTACCGGVIAVPDQPVSETPD